jgi:acyl dehydratase
MPLDSTMVGTTTEAIRHDVDARWLMAYAAGLGDLNSRYLDTAAHTVVAHPVFPVCLEWPAVLATRNLPGYASSTADERARGVHAAHDLHLYRPIRAGDRLTTRATVVQMRQIKPGAAQLTRLDTVDEAGVLVCRTYQLGISRGVSIAGGDRTLEEPPAWPDRGDSDGEGSCIDMPVAPGAAHVYTECARIWNPIHTDRRVALAAGLPDIILHGTATLALAVSRLVDRCVDGDPGRVRRLGGRFLSMVRMPSTLTLRIDGEREQTVSFSVLTQDGEAAVGQGFLTWE